MPLIFFEKTDNTKAIVTTIHYQPGLLPQDVLANGVYVEEIPEPTMQEGKDPVLYYDIVTGDLYYEYVDRPLTPEEKMQLLEQENQDLKNRVELMQQALDGLLLGGM